MKKITLFLLALSAGTIIYFFIKEQFTGVVLSHIENMILSVTYFVVGLSVLILFKQNNSRNQQQNDSKNK